MKKVIFIRTAPYDYKLLDKSLYESLDNIGLQKSQPHILEPSIETEKKIRSILKKYKPSRIFCSQFTRSQETAKLFSDKIKIVSELNELRFSMDNFSNKKEFTNDDFDHEKINEVRFNFSQILIEDGLQEKQKDIKKRIVSFKKILENYPENQTIFCFSHGFIMKLYENLLLTDKEDVKTLVSSYNWKKPTYDFLKGFVVYRKNNSLKIRKLKID